MSRDELHRLLEDARRQPLLLSGLQERAADSDAALRWAAEQGYRLSPEDLSELKESEAELSDEELDQAAGGDWAPGSQTPPPPPPTATDTGGEGGG